MNLQPYHNDLLFVPFGGTNEIGMNLNAYHYKGKWLLVDCGAGFADDHYPGIDMLVPDVHFLAQHQKDIVGLILTHAHEDHLGGVPYIWDELRCPIYTTQFTANFLRMKLADMNIAEDIPVHILPMTSPEPLSLAPFTIHITPLTHSIAEMHALFIETEAGNIFHTGDWKFDPMPLIGNKADFNVLKAFGDKGVLALMGDSTNIFKEGNAGSEGDVKDSLINLIQGAKQMVVVTTFASNIARVESILHAAKASGRKVVVAGRSLWRIIRAATESGYLQDIPEILEEPMLPSLKPHEVLVMCTGCQGEPMAATSKFVSGTHPYLQIRKGDTMIFSSKIIPGNDKRISFLMNKLTRMGIEVLTERDHFVHVSGHPCQDEVATMYELLRPHLAVPVHGEAMHLHYHAKFARKCNVPEAIELKNGDVLHLKPKNSEIIGSIKTEALAVNGHYLLSPNSPVLKARKRFKESGIVIVSLVCDAHGRLVARPIVKGPGVFDRATDQALIESIQSEIEKQFKRRPTDYEQKVRGIVRHILKHEVGKESFIDVSVSII